METANFWGDKRGGKKKAHLSFLLFKLVALSREMTKKLSCILKGKTASLHILSEAIAVAEGCYFTLVKQYKTVYKSNIIVLVLLISPPLPFLLGGVSSSLRSEREGRLWQSPFLGHLLSQL